jgi:hypothetical protein
LRGVFDEAIHSTFARCFRLGIFTEVEWIAASLEDSLLAAMTRDALRLYGENRERGDGLVATRGTENTVRQAATKPRIDRGLR